MECSQVVMLTHQLTRIVGAILSLILSSKKINS
jgi:hypothetical protein